jgi:hypothetical protein
MYHLPLSDGGVMLDNGRAALLALALLIGYRAAGLARGLAASLAFPASAVFQTLAQTSGVDGAYVPIVDRFHAGHSPL